jgi:hypothetical protein
MKKAVLIVCAIALTALVAGCGQAAPDEKYLSHMEKIVALLRDNKSDTGKAQAAVKSYLDANLPEMKTLLTQFGKEQSKKIGEDPVFLGRVLKLVDALNELAKTDKAFLDNPSVAQALEPLIALTK